MRVISGTYKSRPIHTLKSKDTRPTTDKVRENMFNILGPLHGDVLDLFAGSGALGIEALSRGAHRAVFIDGAKDAVKILRVNTEFVEEPVEIYRNDALRAVTVMGKKNRSFDIIFLDPPYHKGLMGRALGAIHEHQLLADGGVIVAETHKDERYDTEPFSIKKEVTYGTIHLKFLYQGEAND